MSTCRCVHGAQARPPDDGDPARSLRGLARSSVGYLRLGSLVMLAIPGEMEPVMAARIRDRLHLPSAMLLGLCDDELGYLMRGEDARDPEFRYERSMSPCVDAGEIIGEALGAGR